MDLNFEHTTLGQRVLFGAGKAFDHLTAEVDRLGACRAMLIASSRHHQLVHRLSDQHGVVRHWNEVRQHVPAGNLEAATTAAKECHADLIISIGGGSATGLAKAVALATGIPVIAVPTTYSGSETTPMWGITADGLKQTGTDFRVLPVTVIYDAELSRALPVELSVASGLNAMAHCVETLWAPKTNPINQAMALEGARALNLALRGIVADPNDLSARGQALYGCYLAGVAFASAGAGLHHKICHVLGGAFNLPHAQTHAAVLPYVLALNAPAVPDLAIRLVAALSGHRISAKDEQSADAAAVASLDDLYRDLGVPNGLAGEGFTTQDVPGAAKQILDEAPVSNPVTVTKENLTTLLTHAVAGTAPDYTYWSTVSFGPIESPAC